VARGVIDASSELDAETEVVLSDEPVAETDDSALDAGERDEVTDVNRLGDGRAVVDEKEDSDDESVSLAEAVSVTEPRVVAVAIDADAEEEAELKDDGTEEAEMDRDDAGDGEASELSRDDPVAAPVNVWLGEAEGEKDSADENVAEPEAVSQPVDDGEAVGGWEAPAEFDDEGDSEDRLDNVADPV